MHVIRVRNVNDALTDGIHHLTKEGEPEPSRDGPVLVAREPVTTVYSRPWERVLFSPVRDANPFFHLMESVWMMAGRRDSIWLDRYVKNFSARFAEEGVQHGAYGHRWREHFTRYADTPDTHSRLIQGRLPEHVPIDQITQVAEMLRRDPTTRRAVLTMWDPVVDLNLPSLDLPCNTQVYFRSRPSDDHDVGPRVLDITVLCRSNDMVMGAYGANAVHMSVMGEIVAGLAGMRPGVYRQVSNNFHVYERDLKKIAAIDRLVDLYREAEVGSTLICGEDDTPAAITDEAMHVMRDCQAFCSSMGPEGLDRELARYARSSWFRDVVIPMQIAHDDWRRGEREHACARLMSSAEQTSCDWHRAGAEWMQRRIK
jgi:thymidylate synthase